MLEDLSWSFSVFREVGTSKVPPELIRVDFLEEVSSGAEGFQVEEFLFDAAMRGFDIGVSVGCARRKEAMCDSPGEELGVEAAGAFLLLLAAVFGAVVSGQDHVG